MEEDVETRKISSSFLRDHSYATEGERVPQSLSPQQVGAAGSGPCRTPAACIGAGPRSPLLGRPPEAPCGPADPLR